MTFLKIIALISDKTKDDQISIEGKTIVVTHNLGDYQVY